MAAFDMSLPEAVVSPGKTIVVIFLSLTIMYMTCTHVII